MAQSRSEIQKRSDENRGMVQKNFKLPAQVVADIERLALARGKPQAAVVAEAIALLMAQE